jgi:hypothetical protein
MAADAENEQNEYSLSQVAAEDSEANERTFGCVRIKY